MLLGVYRKLRGSRLSAAAIACSVAVGLAVGLMPVYGMHGVLVVLVCWALRLDAALAFAATMISNPLTLPFLIALELKLGANLAGSTSRGATELLAGEGWGEAALQLALGTAVLSTTVAATGALLVWTAVRRWRRPALATSDDAGV